MSQFSDHNSTVGDVLGGRGLTALAIPLLAGMALRLWWIFHLGQITFDSHVYGELARNALQHHVYGFSNASNGVTPSLIRLPGYPLFLAICFRLFGMENYTAVMLVQAALDVWACLLIAGLAGRVFGRKAGLTALWMAALCPFTANYAAVPLTEELTIFCMALAFYGLARWGALLPERGKNLNAEGGKKGAELRHGFGGGCWLAAVGFALAYAILLRPEQGMLAAAVVPAMLWMGVRRARLAAGVRAALIVAVLAVLPLVPWTVRNWRTMHVVQPLAPRFAVDPGEPNPYGFQRWYRTWALEFASTVTTYWEYVGDPIQIADLPNRAFDSNAQYEETEAVYAQYSQGFKYTAAVDAQFDKIARKRIAADPIRYYVALPVGRVLDMMFRPRTEMIPVPVEWWKFRKRGDWFSLAYAGLNLAFFAVAAVGLARRSLWRDWSPVVLAMVATIAMRVVLLLTIDNAEQRYTVEFFPILIVLASGGLDSYRRAGLDKPKTSL